MGGMIDFNALMFATDTLPQVNVHVFDLPCQRFPLVIYEIRRMVAYWNLPPEGDQNALTTPLWSLCLLSVFTL